MRTNQGHRGMRGVVYPVLLRRPEEAGALLFAFAYRYRFLNNYLIARHTDERSVHFRVSMSDSVSMCGAVLQMKREYRHGQGS
ncbi:hypothetical protein M758_UG095300 [Ceratodon purpureus]|nr:hypothetical protein M758_UG095300 [Ceratodon purpureus]